MQAQLLNPNECLPPHRVTRPEHRDALALAFVRDGWDPNEPALVGYRLLTGQVQLLSGSHRWDAARLANISIPVVIYKREDVDDAWGNVRRWFEIMRSGDVPTQQL